MNHYKISIDKKYLNTCLSKIEKNEIDISLPISLETKFYNPEYFKKLINAINKYATKHFEFKDKIFKTKRIRLDVGDILNRHIWYYRYCEQYMLSNNISNEIDISEKIRGKFKKDAYLRSKKQGKEWFKNNIDAINQLIPKKFKVTKNFQLNDEITVLYEGDENNPRIEYICYNYWLNHPEYKKVEKALREICETENSIIKRAYKKAVNYYVDRLLKRGENVQNLELFKKQSHKYLFDEGITACLIYRDNPNTIEFYFGGRETNGTQVFRGKKAQKDPIIQKYLQGSLKGADQRKFISVKMVEK